MTLQQILAIVIARRRLVLSIYLCAILATLIATLSMPKQFSAVVSIVVDQKADPIAGAVLPDVGSLNYVNDQLEIMQSDRVAARAVKLLGSGVSRSAYDAWTRGGYGKMPFEYYYGAILKRGLDIKSAPSSNVIVLKYMAPDPQFAADAANAFAQAYLDTTVEMRVDPARQYATWFDDRLQNLRANLEAARNRLTSYQRQHGIVGADERYDQEVSRLNALTEKLAEVQKQRIETASRQRTSGSESSPDVLANPVIQSIKSEMTKAMNKLSELNAEYGASHPERIQVESKVMDLKQQLSDETRRISDSAATANRAAVQQEAELKAVIEAQKKQVLELLPEHDEISVLQKDVESAQRAYETVAQRMSQINLESKSEQANLTILNPALPPMEPSRPRLRTNLLVAASGGLLFAICIALGLESVDRRVHGAGDLAVVEDLPVLGVLRPGARGAGRSRLLLPRIILPRLPGSGATP